MAITFTDYEQKRYAQDLAEVLMMSDIDIDQFCEHMVEQASQIDPESSVLSSVLLYEFWGSPVVKGLGAAAGHVLGGVGNALGRGASAVGNAIGAGAKAASNVANQGLQAAGRGMQNVGNAYQQTAQREKLQKIIQSLQQLQQQLTNMGFKAPEANDLFRRLTNTLQNGIKQLSQDSSLRFGNNKQTGSLWNNIIQQQQGRNVQPQANPLQSQSTSTATGGMPSFSYST